MFGSFMVESGQCSPSASGVLIANTPSFNQMVSSSCMTSYVLITVTLEHCRSMKKEIPIHKLCNELDVLAQQNLKIPMLPQPSR